ncbi:putative signal transducing protein [Xanthobacter sp. TB0139]|uniref:putative signal transducing protein n=1 Tax=Xanthobacter sp. TB0139 TaxID=3459178 RepID=UPI00403965EE
MRELLRTNDLVLLGAIEAFLSSAGIGHLVLDAHISALEGSIGVLPRRLMVMDEDMVRARRLLMGAGFGEALPPLAEKSGFWDGPR